MLGFEQSLFYYNKTTLLCEHFEFRDQLCDSESSEQSLFIQLLKKLPAVMKLKDVSLSEQEPAIRSYPEPVHILVMCPKIYFNILSWLITKLTHFQTGCRRNPGYSSKSCVSLG
jgi:hypothetical protein